MTEQKTLSLEDCLTAAAETKELLLGPAALDGIPRLLRDHYDFTAACIIADENTNAAAGTKVKEVLSAAGVPLAEALVFPGSPRLHAEYRHIARITAHITSLPGCAGMVPIAVGAGTVNDLVKRAASELNLPYLCVPAAASVDGYTSYGAALLSGGFKQTFPCPAPRTLAASTAVLREAPAYLSSSGFGDLAGKIIAGTDWIIAGKAGALGAPGTEPIDPLAWNMTQTGLLDTLKHAEDAVRGDADAVELLFTALSVTGFAMQRLRSSRPVSGCEHLWSHIWEMEDLSVDGSPVTHGHKVALGTLVAAAFTEALFAQAAPPLPSPDWRRPSRAEREAEVRAAFTTPAIRGTKPADAAVRTALEKLGDEKHAAALADALRDNWKEIRENVREKLPPYGELRDLLARGGCPVLPGEINLTRSEVIAAARRAQMIRNRYTVLDLAWDVGVFEETLARMEAGPYL
ncbi:MAG: sn-glycerol-1-phosphate dehydrogenase [Spirochaetaceae bacterium]|jgi:glycerol-1-phosphate dehydrogenase [NAD(P)+]|nr:sn-glycerol-1-phosphate dehydrogenase [Spirochaetaceae bacterium]